MRVPVLAMLTVLALRSAPGTKSVQSLGMTVAWKFMDEEIIFTMRAPSTGWVAIGFNTVESLAGTNLIMGSVEHGRPTLSDRTILRPGTHVPVGDAGGNPHTRLISGQETDGATEIQFAIKTSPGDNRHFVLKSRLKVSLLMAYSESDDWMHHSLYRTAVWIEL